MLLSMRNLKDIVQILKKPGTYSEEYIFYAGNNWKDEFELKVNDCPVKMLYV